jgi:hypothetical protein
MVALLDGAEREHASPGSARRIASRPDAASDCALFLAVAATQCRLDRAATQQARPWPASR